MDDRKKLKHLLEHWMLHNEEHVRSYREWAEKADAAGEREVAEILRKVSDETARAQELFKKAHELL